MDQRKVVGASRIVCGCCIWKRMGLGLPAAFTGLAAIGSIAPSTLRAYITRGEGAVPQPQATIGGRPMWSRPVAHAWAALRRRPAPDFRPSHPDGDLPASGSNLQGQLDQAFFAALWGHPAPRSRWAPRHRTPDAVHEVAADLAHRAAIRLQDTVPAHALAAILTPATLDALAAGIGIPTPVRQVLGWLTQHHPGAADQIINTITDEAEQRLGIGRR